MNGHTAARVITELGLQQAQPVLHHFPGRGRPVVKRPVLRRAEAREAGGPGQLAPGWDKVGTLRSTEEPHEGETAGPGGQRAGQACGPCGEAPPLLLTATVPISRKPSWNTLPSSFLSTVSPTSPPCQPALGLQGHSLTLTSLSVSGSAGPRGLGRKHG